MCLCVSVVTKRKPQSDWRHLHGGYDWFDWIIWLQDSSVPVLPAGVSPKH